MRCSKAQILLSASIDGEISEREDIALKEHLIGCSQCAELSVGLSAVHNSMELWKDEEPSEWMAQSFSYKLADFMQERSASPAPRRALGWRFGAASAGVAAAALIALNAMQYISPSVTPVVNNKPAQLARPNPIVAQTIPEPKPEPKPTVRPKTAEPKPVTTTGRLMAVAPRPSRAHTGLTRRPWRTGVRTRRYSERSYLVASNVSYTSPSAAQSMASRDGEELRRIKASAHLELMLAKAVGEGPGERLAENLGGVHLRVNESTERIRGTLRKAADLMASRADTEADTSPSEGSLP